MSNEEEKNTATNNSKNENNNNSNNNNLNDVNNSTATTLTPSNNEKANLASEPPKPTDDKLTLPSYEEAVNFNSFVSNLEGKGENTAINSSFYISNQDPNESYVSQQSFQVYSAQQVPQSQQQKAPGSQQPQGSTYSLNSNTGNTSFLQGQPSKPVNNQGQNVVNNSNIQGTPTNPNDSYNITQSANSSNSFLQGQPSKPISPTNGSSPFLIGQPASAISNTSYLQNQPSQPVNSNPNTSYLQSQPYQPVNSNPNTSFFQGHPSQPVQEQQPPNSNNNLGATQLSESKKTGSTSYLTSQSNNTNISYLQGQPSKPINSNTTSQPAPQGSYYQAPPGQPGQPAPQGSYYQAPPGQPGQPTPQGSYPYVAPTPVNNTGANVYPPVPTGSQYSNNNNTGSFSQYPPAPKHTFDRSKPESATNQNFETCYDGEYQDMNGTITIGTGSIGTKKIQVPALSRMNIVKSTIGNNIIDIRGARILNGESQIVFEGTLGRIILVVPKYISLIIEDQYCIGEVFSYRPTEVPVNEAMKKGLPVIRVTVKNTVGDINIIEKEIDLTISSEGLSSEIKKLRKEYFKNSNKNHSSGGNGGTSLVSMKTMFMKSFNSAKQQITGNPANKPVNTAPYPQPGQAPYPQPGQPPYSQPGQPPYPQPGQAPYPQPGQSQSYSMPTPYGAPAQPVSPYGTPSYSYPGQPYNSYPYQGYPPPQTPQNSQAPQTSTAPYYGSSQAPASSASLATSGPASVGPSSSVASAPPDYTVATTNGSVSASTTYTRIYPSISAPSTLTTSAPTPTSTTTTTTPSSNFPYPPRT